MKCTEGDWSNGTEEVAGQSKEQQEDMKKSYARF